MTDGDVIEALECCTGLGCDKCKFNDGEPNTCSCEWELKNAAMEVLKRQQAEIERLKAEKENHPLTKDELMQMVGQPVWTVGVSHTKDDTWAMWDIIEKANDDGIEFGYSTEIVGWYHYGIAWLCYRAKPEVDENGRS